MPVDGFTGAPRWRSLPVAASARSNEILEGGRMNPRRQPAPLGGKPSVLHSQPSVGEHGGRGHPMGAWGEREASPKRELEPQVIAEPEGRSGAFLRTVCFVLATGVCYYVATQIAWALCFPDSKVSLFFPRTRCLFPFCCWFPLGTGGPTHSPPRALIFWRPSRRTGRRCTHYTARLSTRSRMSPQRPGFASLLNLPSRRSRFVTR